jgi:hypothetical protein
MNRGKGDLLRMGEGVDDDASGASFQYRQQTPGQLQVTVLEVQGGAELATQRARDSQHCLQGQSWAGLGLNVLSAF